MLSPLLQGALRGACLLCVVFPGYCADLLPAAMPPVEGKYSAGTAAAPVHTVADQMNAFLARAVEWVDVPAARVSVGVIRPRIQAAVLSHPEVRLALEQQQTAAQVRREALAGMLPQIAANADSGRRHFDQVSTPYASVPDYTQRASSFGVSASQLLYDFGAVGGRLKAQDAREIAAQANALSRSSQLALRAVSAWYELFRARELVNLAETNRQSRRQILNFIEEREQLGGSSRSDVLRVRARLSDAQAALVFAESRRNAADAAYREVFNTAPPQDLPLPEVVAVDPERYAADLAVITAQNAQIAVARAQSEAAGFDAQAASASLLPSIRLEVSATRRDLAGGDAVLPGTDKAAMLVFKHNLYSGGAEIARARQAGHRAAESQLEEENLRRQIERAVVQTIAEVRNTTDVVAARKETVQVAAMAYEAVREQFAFRRGTLLDLLRAQEDLYLAGRDLIDGVVDHALTRYRLLHLSSELGPLFEIAAPAPLTPQ